MAGTNGNTAATHFGRQMKKERLAHGWSLRELAERTGINPAHLSRIENGTRPATRKVAEACDGAFPERRGWFADWYDESRGWSEIPPGFRSWTEIEESTALLRDWCPSIITGLLQTADYCRTLTATFPGVAPETVTARVTARMQRQRRVLHREQRPPAVTFLLDELALCRRVGSAEIMAAQMDHLAAMAQQPNLTLQVMPAIEHAANASGFVVADVAAYTETVSGGNVLTGEETVTSLSVRFDSLRAECYRASESMRIIAKAGETWRAGGSPPIPMPTAATA
jgi:hypothetical protein